MERFNCILLIVY